MEGVIFIWIVLKWNKLGIANNQGEKLEHIHEYIRKTPFSLSISHHHISKVHIGIRWHLKIGFLKGIFEASEK